ncbi:hypothetical protein H4582DRAFT_1941506 [Lactarius indigo]|nr:hypothetical protein H4582DRAFT_1941506 [Lactarius indigo]
MGEPLLRRHGHRLRRLALPPSCPRRRSYHDHPHCRCVVIVAIVAMVDFVVLVVSVVVASWSLRCGRVTVTILITIDLVPVTSWLLLLLVGRRHRYDGWRR